MLKKIGKIIDRIIDVVNPAITILIVGIFLILIFFIVYLWKFLFS